MPLQVADNVLAWGADLIEPSTVEQAAKTARMPFVKGPVALMPDAHRGIGSSVGTVFATKGAIIPAAIGVDIGCGMAAIKLNLKAEDLPSLDKFLPIIADAVPGGVGKGHERRQNEVNVASHLGQWPAATGEIRFGKRGARINSELQKTAINQCGTLGSGNHFFEICLDTDDNVWIVLHSGSRGVGNKLARIHIEEAQGLMKKYFIDIEDKDLAYLVEGTAEFQAYINDMQWSQRYARLNRDVMLDAAINAFRTYLVQATKGVAFQMEEVERINCHHNFTQRENHMGHNVWVTRKGAIKANVKDRGIIPGSMGSDTYIVTGLGNVPSLHSCSHGAGRPFSRSQARREVSMDDFKASMAGKVWNEDQAEALIDESPAAYKDITKVMAAQADLVQVDTRLHQIFNYKGL